MNEHEPARGVNSELTALGGTYRLLARLWLHEVDGPLLRQLCGSPLSEALRQAGGAAPLGADAAVLEELAVDYCRLFIGPRDHLPPLQSVWQSGQLQGPLVVSMHAFLDLLGLDATDLTERTLVDHLGVQLDVMGRIVDRTLQAMDERHQQAAREAASTFFVRHLTWPYPLLDAAEERAETEFYAGLMRMTRGLLRSETEVWLAP